MSPKESEKIGTVYKDERKRLLGYIRNRIPDHVEAEDILQDVFYQFIGNAEPVEQITAWLFTVARNKITDKKRKQQPESLEESFVEEDGDGLFGWSEILFDQRNNPESDYLRNLFWEELNKALNELPAEQRDAFVQHEIEGVSFNELSERTGETVNTLLSRKRYAVLHLRSRLRVLKDELLNY